VLNEAVAELKIKEFPELYEEKEESAKKILPLVVDCQVETDMELTFPSDYVENVSERMNLYRELDNVRDEQELELFEKKMVDRFGALPEQTINLLMLVRVRWAAQKLGFEKLTLKQNRMTGFFTNDDDSPYFQSEAFGKILNYYQNHVERCKLRENGGKRSIVFQDVECVGEAFSILRRVNETSGE
jgi:transcription-repair coupling factor (superfamily II helicase)